MFFIYSCFIKDCPTKASCMRQCRLVLWVVRVWRWLIEIHGVYQQEKRRHTYICLYRFSLCRWITQSLNQEPGTPTFWHCRVRFCWSTFLETAVHENEKPAVVFNPVLRAFSTVIATVSVDGRPTRRKKAVVFKFTDHDPAHCQRWLVCQTNVQKPNKLDGHENRGTQPGVQLG